jgi:hypothetical protein
VDVVAAFLGVVVLSIHAASRQPAPESPPARPPARPLARVLRSRDKTQESLGKSAQLVGFYALNSPRKEAVRARGIEQTHKLAGRPKGMDATASRLMDTEQFRHILDPLQSWGEPPTPFRSSRCRWAAHKNDAAEMPRCCYGCCCCSSFFF